MAKDIKNIKDMEQGMKAYLLTLLRAEAEKDEYFAESFMKSNKSIDECVQYIYGELYDMAKKDRTKAVGLDDSTVVGMAKHYFDEDKIKIKNIAGGRVSSTAAASTVAKNATVNNVKEVKPKKPEAQMSLDLFADENEGEEVKDDVTSVPESTEVKGEDKVEEKHEAPIVSLFGINEDIYDNDDDDDDDDDEYDSNTANEDFIEEDDNEEDE